MSSETSIDASGFRPWHFFVLAGLVAATAGVLLSRPGSPAGLILLSLALGAGALVAFALYRTLWPLAAPDAAESFDQVSRRARAAVEREKMLLLRSIKELEFDRAMGKVSEADFEEMAGRLRARAIGVMRQLDRDASGYRELIEQELQARLRSAGLTRPAPGAAVSRAGDAGAVPAPEASVRPDADQSSAPADQSGRRACSECGTTNDPDARFCKSCGWSLA